MQKSPEQYHAPAQEKERPDGWLLRVPQEPLLHFLLLGIVLFAASHFWGDSKAGPEDDEIVVSEGKVRSLANIFHRTWQRRRHSKSWTD